MVLVDENTGCTLWPSVVVNSERINADRVGHDALKPQFRRSREHRSGVDVGPASGEVNDAADASCGHVHQSFTAVSPDGRAVYVTNRSSHTVSVISRIPTMSRAFWRDVQGLQPREVG